MRVSINHFRLEELVPKKVFEERGAASQELLDPRAFKVLNFVRELLDCPIIINDWLWGGGYDASGLRIHEQFSDYSQHNFGRGFDLKFSGLSVREATLLIIKNHSSCPEITFIEIDRDWLHIDFRFNRNGEPLVLWSPDRGYVTIEEYTSE